MNRINTDIPLAIGYVINRTTRQLYQVPDLISAISRLFITKDQDTQERKGEPSPLLAKRLVDFKQVFASPSLRAKLNEFLTTIFFPVDETKFFLLMEEILKKNLSFEETYLELLNRMAEVQPNSLKTFFARFRSTKVLKQTLSQQVKTLMNGIKTVQGYAEIGPAGRLIRPLQFRSNLTMTGPMVAVADKKRFSDYIAAGFPLPYDTFVPLNDYAPLSNSIGKKTLELVICPMGLHQVPEIKMDTFLKSIHEVLKSGGSFILREHDVKTKDLAALINVVHTVVNAATGKSLSEEARENRHFRKLSEWIKLIEKKGFKLDGPPLTTKGDPTENTLLRFIKIPNTPAEAHLHSLEVEMKKSYKDYERPQFHTYLTTLEWHLVAIAKEYADFIKVKPLHQFPFFKHILNLWKVFFDSTKEAIQASNFRSVITSSQMRKSLGLLLGATLELLLKGLALAPLRLNRKVQEQDDFNPVTLLVKDAEEYAEFLTKAPFYEFPYFKKAWNHSKALLTASKKSFFSSYLTVISVLEYTSKGFASLLVSQMSKNTNPGNIHLIVEDRSQVIGQDLDPRVKILNTDLKFNLKAVEVPRHLQFRDILRKMAYTNATVKTIAGQKKIQIKIKIQINDHEIIRNLLGCYKLGEIPIIGETTAPKKYVRLEVDVSELNQVIKTLESSGAEVSYIHDY